MVEELKKMGFELDATCPAGVTRYEKRGDDYLSVTLDGEKTLYGVFLFDRHNSAIWRKRVFEGNMSFDTLMMIMDKTSSAPAGVREYPRDTIALKDCK